MIRKYLAVMLCLMIAAAFAPGPAFAAAKGAPDEGQALDNAAIAAEFQLSLGEINRDDPVDEQEYMNLIAKAIEHAADPKDFAAWAGSELFRRALGLGDGDKTEEIMKSLDALTDQISVVSSQVQQVNDNVIKSDISRELNKFFTQDWDDHLKLYYNTLRGIDKNTKLTDQERYDHRMQALLFDFTDNTTQEVSGAICGLDDKTNILGHYLTDGLAVAYQSDKANLMDMYHYFCKLNHPWENQSYDDWIGFQNAVFGMYMNAAFIDRLSLNARIQALEKAGKSHDTLDQQLDSLKATIKEVNEIYVERKVTKRPDNERYYQYPGHEKLLYTKAKQQKIPEEPDKNIGVNEYGIKKLQGIRWEYTPFGIQVAGPKLEFWRTFISYNLDEGGTTLCPTAEWFQQVYKDYGSNTSLFDIFFSENEGNFTKPAGADSSWEFMVDPDRNHPMSYYDGRIWRADQVVTPAMMCNGKLDLGAINEKGVAFYTYHYNSNGINEDVAKAGQPFIGIGIKAEGESQQEGSSYDTEGILTVDEEPATVITEPADCVFTGQPIEPKLNVVLDGRTLTEGTDYNIVGYTDNTAVGSATVQISGAGEFEGAEASGFFRIFPAKAGIAGIKAGAKKLTVKMSTSPDACGADSFRIQYRVKGTKRWKSATGSGQTVVLKKLKKGKRYQVRAQAVSIIGEMAFAGDWTKVSTTKKVK